jgi:hypothetical protein
MLKKLLILFLGTLSWSVVMIKSGWIYSFGAGFWGPNGHDGVWHIALAQSLARGSFNMPTFAGEAIKNYHLGFDIILAILTKLTSIPASILYFQILPPILAFLVGLLTYKFVFLWIKSEKASFLSTFFVYFGGSLGFLVGNGESTFWSQQAISTLINPPFALSLVIILLGLISLLKKKWLLAGICFGILVQIKIYAGLLVLGGLLVSKNYKAFLTALLISLVLFLPFNRNPQGLIVYQPFWFLETMMQLTDRVGWIKFGEAMVNYKAGGLYVKAVLAYGVAFVLFVIGNFGTRILFLLKWVKFDSINTFFYSIIAAGVIIPMFFLQKGTPWNTIQFLYYSLFFSGILAGITLSRINNYLLVGAVLLTIPTSILTLKDVYLPSRPPAKVTTEELSALAFLKSKPDGVVLTYPFDRLKAKEAEGNPPRPLYLYESTAYVSAYANKPVFLEDEVNLDITGYDWKTRRLEVEDWYKEADQLKAREFLKKNNIKYIYWLKGQRGILGETQLGIEKVFENKEVNVFMVKS